MLVLDIALEDLILTLREAQRCAADTAGPDCDGFINLLEPEFYI